MDKYVDYLLDTQVPFIAFFFKVPYKSVYPAQKILFCTPVEMG